MRAAKDIHRAGVVAELVIEWGTHDQTVTANGQRGAGFAGFVAPDDRVAVGQTADQIPCPYAIAQEQEDDALEDVGSGRANGDRGYLIGRILIRTSVEISTAVPNSSLLLDGSFGRSFAFRTQLLPFRSKT